MRGGEVDTHLPAAPQLEVAAGGQDGAALGHGGDDAVGAAEPYGGEHGVDRGAVGGCGVGGFGGEYLDVLRPDGDRTAVRQLDEVLVAEEFGDEAVGRGAEHLARGALLGDRALVEDDHAVGELQGLLLVVGDEDRGEPGLLLDTGEFLAHLDTQPRVEVGQGLVEEEYRGTYGDGAGQRDALLLAAGQLLGLAAGEVGEADQLQRLARASAQLSVRDAAHLQSEGDVLLHGHVREERVRLEDHADVAALRGKPGGVLALQQNAARGGFEESGDHAQGGGLAAAARSEQRGELPTAHGQIELPYRCRARELPGYGVELNHRRHRRAPVAFLPLRTVVACRAHRLKTLLNPTRRSVSRAAPTVAASSRVLTAATVGS